MARIDFDSTGVDTRDPFELLPDNTEVPAVLIKSEMKQTKAGTGHYLALTFKCIDGPHENRQFFANLNIDNPNDEAVKIAERELAALCQATGVVKAQDSEELHDIPVMLVLGVEKGSGDYPARNKIKNYRPMKTGAKHDEQPAAAAGKKSGPWAK